MYTWKLPNREPFYEVVQRWISNCLREDGALFGAETPVWTLENVDRVAELIAEQDGGSQANFLDHLRQRVSAESSAVIQLAAEILYIHLLPVASVTGEKKIEIVEKMLDALPSGQIPEDLAEQLEGGIANAGVAYNSSRAAQIRQLVGFIRAWKRTQTDEQTELLSEPWRVKEFVEKDAVPKAVAQRSFLLHFFHPETFTSTVSERYKKKMVRGLSRYVKEPTDDPDRALRQILVGLWDEFGEFPDIYHSPIREMWDSDYGLELRLASNLDEVRESVAAFHQAVHEGREEAEYSLRHPGYWVHDPVTGHFAPAKWAAFAAMTPELYSEAQERQRKGAVKGFDGTRSRNQLSKLVRGKFASDPALSAQLRSQLEEAYGADAFRGRGDTGWLFLTLDSRDSALPSFPKPNAVWIEITSLEHGHGGPGWELGKVLWSPTADDAGSRRYEQMKELRPGDLVLHFVTPDGETTKRELAGFSWVAASVEVTDQEPPTAQPWDGRGQYYRVHLRDYQRLPNAVPVRAITQAMRSELLGVLESGGKNLPFTRYDQGVRLAQGQYLATCPRELYELIACCDREVRRCWCWYSGQSAEANVSIAYERKVWGVKNPAWLDGIEEGDPILAVHGLTSDRRPPPKGFPRVRNAEDLSGVARSLWWTTAASAPYEDDEEVWPDAAYPGRIRLGEILVEENQDFGTASYPFSLVDAVRRSGMTQGRPQEAWVLERDLPMVTKPVEDLEQITTAFGSALGESGIVFGSGHEAFVGRFVSSLCAKPFVILTGLSGSGKTQIALKFGEWLGSDQFRLIPVRPDWTGPEPLLGYEDALSAPDQDGRRTWHAPDALQFMLKAATDPKRPYLLILDEMNLAHVERYFADVLSGMESGTPILPNLELDGSDWRLKKGAQSLLALPKNLFVAGTVNVDETTYMFSPKVLDRANTLEFRVATDALSDDPLDVQKPRDVAPAVRGLPEGFLGIATNDRWHQSYAPEFLTEFAVAVKQLHRDLSRFGLEFGHRTHMEAFRLAAMLAAATDGDLDTALDAFAMQKVLPRIHGARRRIEPVLRAMGKFSVDPSDDDSTSDFVFNNDQRSVARLPMTYDKTWRMFELLRANQFVSFSE